MSKKKPSVLCYIPAREGSKRIPGKNSKSFLGKPLIAYTIEQAKQLSFVDKIVVDTDSPDIARYAQKYGAKVPYLRPSKLATDSSKVMDSMLYMLKHLEKENYVPDFFLILQTTSPLREVEDIEACWKRMQKGDATTVLTVCPSHPQLYHLGKKGELSIANKKVVAHSNTQKWQDGYVLNGCFAYIIRTTELIKHKSVITKKTKAVVCPRWRSVDLDVPEDWVMAELLYKNKEHIKRALRTFT